MVPFSRIIQSNGNGFRKLKIEVLQVNMGKYCNQACVHCHVEAGPGRREMMQRGTVEAVLDFLKESGIPTVDITGGAPELNPSFDYFLEACTKIKRHIMDRCNLTVIFEPGKGYLPEFFKRNHVELVCSLPCYSAENVDHQRGNGTFDLSIQALQIFNRLGYGKPGTGLELQLVYNPVGVHLPPPQADLEQQYKEILFEKFGIVFNRLYCLTNMPITRYEKYLRLRGEYDNYLNLLESAFNPSTLDSVMCRNLISVDWEGSVYDCDFNQMLGMPLRDRHGEPVKVWNLSLGSTEGQHIAIGNHCYGCTAGAGSSCGGALLK